METVTSKTILGLHMPTDPRWVDLTAFSLEEILTDHAYCEQKAATACISLIQLYPDRQTLVEELAPIVTEEWGHFRQVLNELKKRNLVLGKQRKDEYVGKLLSFQKKGGSSLDRLLEKLLTCALIEARSCERFRLLSLGIPQLELREFYWKFMVAEAGHYKLFLDLARKYAGEEATSKRWKEYLSFEAEMLKTLTVRGDRIH
jgi:tRNA 2-(methylsulfanyl)-N6-isopentenyladenosine37 hydroxylase